MSKKIYNRPLSPHLTIYQIEWSSITSIWHRITGILLVLILLIILSFGKFLLNPYINLQVNPINLLILYSITQFILIFHGFNGIKVIMWSFNLMISKDSAFKSTNVIFLLFILILISKLTYVFPN